MGSEITYAEVNFKNGPSPVHPKAPSENKTPPTAFQKLPPWVPWVASGLLLLLSIVLLVVIFGEYKFEQELPLSSFFMEDPQTLSQY
ncbi:hypothetical protein lerEdw1_011950 [Lerista edwardsae]|nr:hypothetical protein lerEdw1_011950 [Lerista edwardsae]